MAPEVREKQPATPASDQFSYCTALRDALRGKQLPGHVHAAIERGLEDAPERRHLSMAALVESLQAALVVSSDQRPRALLLDRVERLWLRGVLARSLGDGSAIERALRSAPALVDPPWSDWDESASLRAPPPEAKTASEHASSRQLTQLLRDSHGSLLLVGTTLRLRHGRARRVPLRHRLNLAQVPFTHSPVGSALVFGLGVSLSSFAYTRGRITPIESLRWSTRRALRLLPITMLCSLVIGLIEAVKINFAANMAGAGVTGGILAVLLALEPSERAIKVHANAGMHQSLENALRVSLGAGLLVGPFFYFVVQPYITHPLAEVPEYSGDPQLIVGVSIALFASTAMFLIYGGFTVLMHYVLRLWLAWRTPLPLNLIGMLDRAAELGLLRRVGGGYVFLHRTLLDYFAELHPEREPRS